MITYFPAIYPDELIYSWFCRYYVHSGCLNRKMVLSELYCISENPSEKLIGKLRPEVMERFERMYSIDKLVLNHTMYPQYARFLPSSQKKQFFDMFSIPSGDKYFRFCPLCVDEDRDIYGETYWHRKHQIHTITACPKHRCRLVESTVSANNEQTHTFYPAEDHVFEAEAEPVNNELIRYAVYLEAMFDAPMDLDGDIPIHLLLYGRISRQEYLKPAERKQCIRNFTEEMQRFYRSIGLYHVASGHQIQKVLMGERVDFSVVCQIAYFLGMIPEELTILS